MFEVAEEDCLGGAAAETSGVAEPVRNYASDKASDEAAQGGS